MIGDKYFALPIVAATISLVVRLIVFAFRDNIPLPYHFGITTPNTGAEMWKEAVYWKQHFGGVPAYLGAIVPWYAEYIPPATPGAYAFVLCMCDAITAFIVSRWPSVTTPLLYTLLVLNPVMILLPVLLSLAPLENLVLVVILECCRSRGGRPWLMNAARVLTPTLSFCFLAVNVALWVPVDHASARSAFITGFLGVASIGAAGLLYLEWWRTVHARTSIYAPPDNGVMWYVRLLIIPAFARCMDVFLIQIPAILIMPFAISMPEAEKTTAESGSIPTDRRMFLVLLSVCMSKLFRQNLALADYALVVLLMYSLLGKFQGADGVVRSMCDEMKSLNIFVPVYTLLIAVPLQHSFYTGWVMWDTANPNWVFFPQVAFVGVGTAFLLMFLRLVTKVVLELPSGKVKEA